MQSDGDQHLPGIDQTVAEVQAHADGPVVEAMAWMEWILAGDLAYAWPVMDDQLRLATAQAWIHESGNDPSVTCYDRDILARTLSQPGCLEHPLWPRFSRVVLAALLFDLAGWDADQLGFLSRPRPVAPGYEVVVLGQGSEYRTVDHSQPMVMYPILMHQTEAGWRVARAGADTTPVPGWPPEFPPGRDFYRINQ